MGEPLMLMWLNIDPWKFCLPLMIFVFVVSLQMIPFSVGVAADFSTVSI